MNVTGGRRIAGGGTEIRWHWFPSELVPVGVAATAEGLARLAPGTEERDFRETLSISRPEGRVVRAPGALAAVERAILEYLRGDRRTFDLPLDLSAVGEFDREVLAVAREIPFGETASYGEVAERIGRPGAARAVGSALGRNPVPLVVPCHRVVRSDGSPGGYTGGLDRKRRLLALEGASLPAWN